MVNYDSHATDPFEVLGVPATATPDEIRARYLELVKQYPPDRDPERFREIRSAYETASDPLRIADNLIEVKDDADVSWTSLINNAKANPPRLSSEFVISLGNRTR